MIVVGVRSISGQRSLNLVVSLSLLGGRSIIPDVPGAELGIDSDKFFELEHQPQRVAVVGTGYIGVELAGIFHALGMTLQSRHPQSFDDLYTILIELTFSYPCAIETKGSKVSIFSRTQQILRSFDHIIKDTLKKEMLNIGIDIITNSQVKSLTKSEGSAINVNYVSNGNEGTTEYDTVLWAIGREPLVPRLKLGEAGVTLNDEGYIHVNEYQETVVPGVYALGDVCGVEQLTPGKPMLC